MATRAEVRLILPLLWLALMAGGCVSKSHAKREAAMAFQLGERQGSITAEQIKTAVFFKGQVRNTAIPWHPGMTLSQGILEAGYLGRQDPRTIIVTRNGIPALVDVRRLMRGQEDGEILPHDMIELR